MGILDTISNLNQSANQSMQNSKGQKSREQLEQEAKAEKAKKPLVEQALGDYTDRASTGHKVVCIAGGLIPGITYSMTFCKWLKSKTVENGSGCDWCIVSGSGDSMTYKLQSEIIKEYKKQWIKERAGELKQKKEDDKNDELAASDEALKKLTEYKDIIKELEKKLELLKLKINSLNGQISEAKKRKSSYVSKMKRAGEKNPDTSSFDAEIESYIAEKNKTEAEIEKTKAEIEKYKALEEEQNKKAKNTADGSKWWFRQLNKWKTAYIASECQKNGEAVYDIYDISADSTKPGGGGIALDDLVKMGAVANNENDGSNGTYSWIDYKTNPDLEGKLSSVCKSIFNRKSEILSIANEMDPAILGLSKDINPDVSSAFLAGVASNTFALAAEAKNLLTKEQLEKQTKFLTEATKAALNKLKNRVTSRVNEIKNQLLDFSEIKAIPQNALKAMNDKRLTVAQIIEKIKSDKIDDYVKDQEEIEREKEMEKQTEMLNEHVKALNYLVGDKIEKFNNAITTIRETMNQGPDWYLEQINKIEEKYESEIMKSIDDIAAGVLDKKYMFCDALVDIVAYNLVIPINAVQEKIQLEIFRKIDQAKMLVILKAKALIQKALLKILALFGA